MSPDSEHFEKVAWVSTIERLYYNYYIGISRFTAHCGSVNMREKSAVGHNKHNKSLQF